MAVERNSESESQTGNSGSEDNSNSSLPPSSMGLSANTVGLTANGNAMANLNGISSPPPSHKDGLSKVSKNSHRIKKGSKKARHRWL